MRLFTKLILVTCGLTGGGFLFNYLTSSQAPTIVKSQEVPKENTNSNTWGSAGTGDEDGGDAWWRFQKENKKGAFL